VNLSVLRQGSCAEIFKAKYLLSSQDILFVAVHKARKFVAGAAKLVLFELQSFLCMHMHDAKQKRPGT